MGTYVHAGLVNTDKLVAQLLIIAHSADPVDGPEYHAWWESEDYCADTELIPLHDAITVSILPDALRPYLPPEMADKLELTLSILLLGLVESSFRKQKIYASYFEAMDYSGWLLDSEDVEKVKAASGVLPYLRERRDKICVPSARIKQSLCERKLQSGIIRHKKIRIAFEDYDLLIWFLEDCFKLIDAASQSGRGVYFITA